MAGKKNYFTKTTHHFITLEKENQFTSDTMFEFDESDNWNSNHSSSTTTTTDLQFKKPIRSSRFSKKSSSKIVPNIDLSGGNTSSSLPINVPNWSRILRQEYGSNQRRENNDDDDDQSDDDEDHQKRIPPCEFFAKQFEKNRVSSFSVHEGVGRTLKGRDLSRVRDAIWEKIGFQD